VEKQNERPVISVCHGVQPNSVGAREHQVADHCSGHQARTRTWPGTIILSGRRRPTSCRAFFLSMCPHASAACLMGTCQEFQKPRAQVFRRCSGEVRDADVPNSLGWWFGRRWIKWPMKDPLQPSCRHATRKTRACHPWTPCSRSAWAGRAMRLIALVRSSSVIGGAERSVNGFRSHAESRTAGPGLSSSK
jgi:hypothetical protein